MVIYLSLIEDSKGKLNLPELNTFSFPLKLAFYKTGQKFVKHLATFLPFINSPICSLC